MNLIKEGVMSKHRPAVYQEVIKNLDDFTRTIYNDVIIYKLNFTRATFKEAQYFRDLVIEDIKAKKLKMIVDLSECDYIDSTFLGALVIILKKAAYYSGEIKYIKPNACALALIKLTGLYSIFNLYSNLKDAVESFEYPSIEKME